MLVPPFSVIVFLRAWFTLTLGGVLASILLFWTWAKGLEDRFDASHRVFLNEIFKHYISDDDAVKPSEEQEKTTSSQSLAPVGILAPGLTPGDEKSDELERLPTQIHDGKRVHIIVQESPHALSLADGEGRPLQLPRVSTFTLIKQSLNLSTRSSLWHSSIIWARALEVLTASVH